MTLLTHDRLTSFYKQRRPQSSRPTLRVVVVNEAHTETRLKNGKDLDPQE